LAWTKLKYYVASHNARRYDSGEITELVIEGLCKVSLNFSSHSEKCEDSDSPLAETLD
jgi:hypothetical protein